MIAFVSDRMITFKNKTKLTINQNAKWFKMKHFVLFSMFLSLFIGYGFNSTAFAAANSSTSLICRDLFLSTSGQKLKPLGNEVNEAQRVIEMVRKESKMGPPVTEAMKLIEMVLQESKSGLAREKNRTLRNNAISSAEISKVVDILKDIAPDLHLEDVDFKIVGPIESYVKKQTLIKHIDQVIDLLDVSVEEFRSIHGDNQGEALLTVRRALLRTIKVSIDQLRPDQMVVFTANLQSILVGLLSDFWSMKQLLPDLKSLDIKSLSWSLMLVHLYNLTLNTIDSTRTRTLLLESLFPMIASGILPLKNMTDSTMDYFFQVGVREVKLLLPLLKSKIVIPEMFHYIFKYAFENSMKSMNTDSIAGGLLVAQELLNRGIAVDAAVDFVKKISESSDHRITTETQTVFWDLRNKYRHLF